MEFQNFWKERERMCKSVIYVDCPFRTKTDVCLKDCYLYISQNPQEAEQIVEQWAKEHPIVTNEIKLHEIFGDGFKMSARDTLDMRVTFNGKDVSFLEWLKREYQPPKGDEEC